MSKFVISLIILVALVSCAPIPGDSSSTQTPAGITPPDFIEKLYTQVAQELGVEIDALTLVSVEKAMWPDSCLGVKVPGMMCLDVITPGYLIILDTPLGIYELHTNEDGSNYRLVQPEAGSSESGISGQVMIGPTCPGPVAENPPTECADKPYQATISILDTQGNQVTQVQSDSAGRFKISLVPGEYVLHPESENIFPHAVEQTVIVTEGQFVEVLITYDTGVQ